MSPRDVLCFYQIFHHPLFPVLLMVIHTITAFFRSLHTCSPIAFLQHQGRFPRSHESHTGRYPVVFVTFIFSLPLSFFLEVLVGLDEQSAAI
jgi:hypothetical protein